MGDTGEDMQQITTSRIRTWVAAFRTEPGWYALYPVSYRGAPTITQISVRDALTFCTVLTAR